MAAVLQLLLLLLLTRHGWAATPANICAFLVATEVNFALSLNITWRDRREPGSVMRRWFLFHGSIAVTAPANMLTFAAAQSLLPVLMASLVGIVVGAAGNYVAGDRLVFRRTQRPGHTFASRPATLSPMLLRAAPDERRVSASD